MSAIVVLDTTVASYLFQSDKRFAPYSVHLSGKVVGLSFMTVAEMRVGARQRGWGERRLKDLEKFFARSRRLAHDERVTDEYVNIVARGKEKGRPMKVADSWIAANAIVEKVKLLTHDRDFVDLDVEGLDVVCYAPAKKP